MKVWLVGAAGQLGKSIIEFNDNELAPKGQLLNFIATTKSDVDICQLASISEFVNKNHPDIIVNAAAYTNVELAQTETALCMQVNAHGAANLAIVASEADIPLIHISTDYVFDGQASVPYLEDDKTDAINTYGQSKLQGEELIRKTLAKYLIIRTSWLISERGHNFFNTVLRLSKQHPQLTIIDDQVGCPTYASDLAEAICSLIISIAKGQKEWGTFHYCGDTAMTWYELTHQILDEAVVHSKITLKPKVVAISSEEFAARNQVQITSQAKIPNQDQAKITIENQAVRPKYSVLNCQKINDTWGIKSPNWSGSLKRLVQKL
ncbi:dTDP-4-dehydrorhamnose reductase [Shewanella olleyana]|uniref:dTDP-4-dehydrorhamnose reductase n=1 Tax=Shewanella olleyana TaxID=135626 RepID=UPI00200D7483|nr:dTDP-4-dehydrorhamnose reductase [Shewanella olleyana]